MFKHRLRKLIGISGVMCITISMMTGCGSEEETVYRETMVEYGSLVVGKTESGSVDIGTVEQTFDLDLSALQRVELSGGGNSQSGGAGGGMMGGNMGGNAMDMFSQAFSFAGENSLVTSGRSSELTIAEVCVTVGEQVEVGDVLYILEEEGVAELAEELEANVSTAKADLEAVIADQNLSKTSAEYTYETNIAYGEYADAERSETITQLNNTVEERMQALEEAKESYNTYLEKLEQTKTDYEMAYAAQQASEWSRDNVNKNENLYYYTIYAEEAITTKKLADSYAQEIEQLESKLEQAEENIALCEKNLASAKRSYESGLLSAEQTYELRQLAYETAQENYDVTLAYLEIDLATQQEIYDAASAKWEEYTSHIDGNTILSQYSGVITSVDLAACDSLQTGSAVVTLYDTDAISMTVTIDEDDISDIAVGSEANINFTAYPDEVYKASVSEISDATTDSDGNVTYEVTATINGDTDSLFQGMTGDITFITKEMKEVLFVSNRAVTREGLKSYVKIKDKSGDISKVEVETGFSDGVYVEIINGLSEGDVVLIESKVGES